ncbi:MAG: dihydrodipicolinate synthase family protein [Hyphomicrobiales bacterium]|nr:dihydrodipicolinate synthase family protein [Hyphomicrobiales bacterium]MCP5371338.1 dihydrodipicolinate synthase family protein [Hyphomicrobiales bacterium]
MSFQGVLVPVLTPFKANLKPDAEKFAALCRAILDQGAGGLAVFGTTSEANSLSAEERMGLLEVLIGSGIPAARLMPGTGACALPEAIRTTGHAVSLGCGGVLLLPPFYYKGVSDDGIYAFVDGLIQGVGSSDLRVYLYHIPPVAQVGYSVDLVGRLHGAHPGTVVGLKDSSGDWSNTAALLAAYPDMEIFPGSEVFLLDALRAGGAGCITATANMNVPMIAASYATWRDDGADDRQAAITRIRETVQGTAPMVPLMKAYLALKTGDPGWATVRPPMVPVTEAVARELDAKLAVLGYQFPGI